MKTYLAAVAATLLFSAAASAQTGTFVEGTPSTAPSAVSPANPTTPSTPHVQSGTGQHNNGQNGNGQHNDGQNGDGQHNDAQNNDGQHNDGEHTAAAAPATPAAAK